ncbi:hypothetical protein MNAN1_000212 [Malassezia nana]|uniref:NADH dehydrogenase [ubiquinone] 1 alpha subcomplex subunit n=1 Tax=Malassezia nana TaxID=180528 RepID=A0AAF0EGH2_9BASI|nr:hypothetical protein MNAN1_000212 [Malassezia nana]
MTIWRALSRFFRIGNARYIVGHDLENNTYYEFPSLHPTDPRRTRRVVKWKNVPYPSDFNPKDMAIQWDAWMRHTRKHPPTIQHNAMVLQMREQAQKAQVEANREREHEYALEEQTQRKEPFAPEPEAANEDSEESVQSTTIQPIRRRE